MTDKAPKLLVDALGAIELAQEFVANCSLESYSKDKMRRSAVERQLEILGIFPHRQPQQPALRRLGRGERRQPALFRTRTRTQLHDWCAGKAWLLIPEVR